MSQTQERIAQFRKMANDDPENELGHFRLGGLLMEDQQLDEAVRSFRRTLELSPQFSKVYQLLGSCLIQLGRRDEAVEILQKGYDVADERGDNIPRDEMVKYLVGLGLPAPASKKSAEPTGGGGTGHFKCHRPGCNSGSYARQLAKPPINDDLGREVYEKICADCWQDWLQGHGKKVLNELRLDFSRPEDQATYDKYMKEFFGFE
jgi:tetratricopeptide (TPR) repeat protein